MNKKNRSKYTFKKCIIFLILLNQNTSGVISIYSYFHKYELHWRLRTLEIDRFYCYLKNYLINL